ncbi:spore cortex biosynthesis protein YabQ [Brevibacillus dissolubilis]|uniref:spore cortex biosynthesis protein YabQ n=1 Tax=Brevibacillus dissolubilis TaxID=1844116 RepID=UPI001116B248|nr:spore cortex biosynthesis protein YabQ [Brevibacillus dissolubilis]
MSIVVQIQTVAYMLLCGTLMGMGFDTYHVFKNKGRFPLWVVFILDLAFWLSSVGLVFYVLVSVNNGVVRFPIFLGMLIGAWFYFLLGSKKYIQFLNTMIKFSIWLYQTILRIIDILIVKPIQFIFQMIWMLLVFLFSILVHIGTFIWRIISFIFAPFARWGRNLWNGLTKLWAGFIHRLQKLFTRKKKDD